MTKKSQRGEIGGLCKNESECVTPDNLDENLKVSCKRRTFKKQSDGKYLKGKRRNGSCMLQKCCWTDQAKIPPKKSHCEGLTIMLHGEQEFVTQKDLQELVDSLVDISSSGSSVSRSRSRSRSNSSSNGSSVSRSRSKSRSTSSSNGSRSKSRSNSGSSGSRSRSRSNSSSNGSRSRSRSNSSSNSGKKKRTRKRVTFAARNNIIGSPQRRSSSNSSLISY
jgi:hypothetical protein